MLTNWTEKYELFSCQERIELGRKLGVTEQQVSDVDIDMIHHIISYHMYYMYHIMGEELRIQTCQTFECLG